MTKHRIFFLLVLFSVLSAGKLLAQDEGIRLSGIVLRLDSIKAIPYANVYIKNTKNGVICDNMGLFSIMVHKKDTVIFSSVGSRTTFFIVPDSLKEKSYSIIQKLPIDTITLKTLEISSWPSIEQFNLAFTREYGVDEEYNVATFNSNPNMKNVNWSRGVGNAVEYGPNGYSYVYPNAHIPLNKVLNPKRWNELVDDWKNGRHR